MLVYPDPPHLSPPPSAFVVVTQVTYDAWQEAIAYCKPGQYYKGIGGIIQSYVEERGFTTVRNFCKCYCKVIADFLRGEVPPGAVSSKKTGFTNFITLFHISSETCHMLCYH